ncbi:CYTH domain-containing protein [Jeongeupia naejangsanensis]|uniref:CYTH domain-containing protein n=1 Tax=Jeongeupia naejangsanensis TaxID=613195 RepID=A0ABS2BLF6_9NEIS|nr:CYTH domain-containing protein [Jeongeupia naejangsanensis]MBM3116447.1 CYTH domain-containing protein [Jeongeupia naejangsanensis]
MAIEIERKFLLASDGWRDAVHRSTRIAQGYLCTDPERTVRVRLKGDAGFLTIKGKNQGIARAEFEYPVPADDAAAMLALCPNVLDKTRHLVSVETMLWEIDEFHGDNAGLVVAEIELPSVDATFVRPDWLGAEVSADPRYFNSALSEKPYCRW